MYLLEKRHGMPFEPAVRSELFVFLLISSSLHGLTISVLFFFMWAGLARTLFSALVCARIDVAAGETFLVADPLIRCWQGSHLLWVLVVVVPAIGLLLLLPIVTFARLYKRRLQLHEVANVVRFSFLVKGYKDSHYYWELVFMVRKLLAVIISVFLPFSGHLQALAVLLVCVFSLYLQVKQQPFASALANRFETISLISSFFVFFFAQLLFVDTETLRPEKAVFLREFASLAIIVVFALYLIYTLVCIFYTLSVSGKPRRYWRQLRQAVVSCLACLSRMFVNRKRAVSSFSSSDHSTRNSSTFSDSRSFSSSKSNILGGRQQMKKSELAIELLSSREQLWEREEVNDGHSDTH